MKFPLRNGRLCFAPEGEGAGGGGGGSAEPGATPGGEGAPAEPPAWFREYAEKQDKRLGDFGRQIAKIKGVEPKLEAKPAEAPQGEKPQGIQHADVDALVHAAMRFSELRATLPEAARAKLDEAREAGRSYEDLVAMAEFASALAPQSPPDPSNGARPRGYGATPPPSPQTAPRVTTKGELAALYHSDRKAWERWYNDPNNDPRALPQ